MARSFSFQKIVEWVPSEFLHKTKHIKLRPCDCWYYPIGAESWCNFIWFFWSYLIQLNMWKSNSEACVVIVQLLSCVRLFTALWTAAHQASLSFTISPSLLKHMAIELVMPSNHVILCCPLLLPPSIISSTRVFSSESALCIRMNVSYTSGTQRNYSTCYHSLGQVRESHSQTGCWGCQQLPSPRACWSAWPSVQKFHTFPIHE